MNGRPLVSREDFRERFGLYLSEVEADRIRENAKAARLPMSTFVRRVALRKKIHMAQPLSHLDFCRRELAPLANNLNQIARACNAGIMPEGIYPTLMALSEQVRLLRLQLMGVADHRHGDGN